MRFHTRSQDAQEGFDDRPCRKQQIHQTYICIWSFIYNNIKICVNLCMFVYAYGYL